MLLMIDNYDSFTYNLVHYLEELKEEVRVYRNDEISIEAIQALAPDMIVLSPGPRTPNESGVCIEVVKKLKGLIPILGICLGHQTIGQVFGAEVITAIEPVHGKVHPITHTDQGVFRSLKNPLNVTRYHSLVIKRETLSDGNRCRDEKLFLQLDKHRFLSIDRYQPSHFHLKFLLPK